MDAEIAVDGAMKVAVGGRRESRVRGREKATAGIGGIRDPRVGQRMGRASAAKRTPVTGQSPRATVLRQRGESDAGGYRVRKARREWRGEACGLCIELSDHR